MVYTIISYMIAVIIITLVELRRLTQQLAGPYARCGLFLATTLAITVLVIPAGNNLLVWTITGLGFIVGVLTSLTYQLWPRHQNDTSRNFVANRERVLTILKEWDLE